MVILIIGSGVLGCSIARSLGRHPAISFAHELAVIDHSPSSGLGVSSRSSQVIHAGIYYPENSYKAKHCVRGKRLLYEYCKTKRIPHERVGKLLVAKSHEQVLELNKIMVMAMKNGVDGPKDALRELSDAEVKRMEPDLKCKGAVWSPGTGIVDSQALVSALQMDAESAGVDFAFGTEFLGAVPHKKGFLATVKSAMTNSADEIECDAIINCAGLNAPNVWRAIHGKILEKDEITYEAFYCKGNYFKLHGQKNPFRRLIYPLPEKHGLGVHLTLDLQKEARFGPDVEWLPGPPTSSDAYAVDPKRADSFYAKIREYWPDLKDGALVPDYSGIRPKLGPANSEAFDFQIVSNDIPNAGPVVHLLGIESPGLTSSMSLAEEVTERVVGMMLRKSF